MRNLIFLSLLFLSTTSSAQFSLQLEQGLTVSDDINYKPIGIGIDYQVASWKGFGFSVGLAFDQVKLEESTVAGSTRIINCGIIPDCLPQFSFVESYESRLLLPLGVSRKAGRFTYGLQVRPAYRVRDAVRTLPHDDQDIVQTKFGENIRVSQLFIDSGNYRVDKNQFSLQLGTDFQYALSERMSFGLNYRYEGLLKDEITVTRIITYGGSPFNTEYFREKAQAHYLVLTVGWRL
jgi:opacity protein-like surface antigen